MDIKKFEEALQLATREYAGMNPLYMSSHQNQFGAYMQAAAVRECIAQGLGQGTKQVILGYPDEQVDGCIALQVGVRTSRVVGADGKSPYTYFMATMGCIAVHLEPEEEAAPEPEVAPELVVEAAPEKEVRGRHVKAAVLDEAMGSVSESKEEAADEKKVVADKKSDSAPSEKIQPSEAPPEKKKRFSRGKKKASKSKPEK